MITSFNIIDLKSNTTGRTRLSIQDKKNIIKLAEKGVTHQGIAKRFQVGRSTVTKILLKKEAISSSIEGDFHDPRKRIRRGPLYKLELKLLKWCVERILESTQNGSNNLMNKLEDEEDFKKLIKESEMKFDKDELIDQAKLIAKGINCLDFEPTIKWIKKFKRKFDLKIKRKSKYLSSEDEVKSTPSLDKESPINLIDINASQNYIVRSNVPQSYKLEVDIKNSQQLPSPITIETSSRNTSLGIHPEYPTYDHLMYIPTYEPNFQYNYSSLSHYSYQYPSFSANHTPIQSHFDNLNTNLRPSCDYELNLIQQSFNYYI